MMKKITLKHNAKSFVVALLASSFLLLFQNCAPGFQIVEEYDSSFSSVEDPSFTKGQQLYNAQCLNCHGSLSSSQKKYRTKEQVQSAIENFPEMAFLAGISDSDLNYITYALANPNGPNPAIYQCIDPATRGLSHDYMKRLTKNEIKNTLKDLLGNSIYNDSDIQSRLNAIPNDTIKTNPDDFVKSPSVFTASVLLDVAARASEIMKNNSNLRASTLGPCTVSNLNETCIRNVIISFGKKILRRPVLPNEVDDYVAFYNSMGADLDGLEMLVVYMLQSPTMVFHIENNVLKVGDRYRLGQYEIASRISYMTINSFPDEALFTAADNAELYDMANITEHVERLLEKQAAQEKVENFFRYYTKLHEAPRINSGALNNAGINANGLGTAMEREALEFANHIWSSNSKFSDLMTAAHSFPRSPAMAQILDAPVVNGQNPVSSSPTHRGLLHRPALLATNDERTSPIIRGAHVRLDYLCDELGEVPNEAVAEREDEVGDISHLANRERVATLTAGNQCMGCHNQINPLGFAFEGFNAFGGVRDIESIFDNDGNIVRQFPINTSVNDPKIESGGPTYLNGSEQLVENLGESKKAQACFAKKMFEYYRSAKVEETYDSCAMVDSSSAAGADSLKSVLVKSIANEDIFWRKDTTAEAP